MSRLCLWLCCVTACAAYSGELKWKVHVNENVEHGPNFLRSNGTDYLLVSVNDQDVGKTTGQVRMMNSVDGSWAAWSVDTPQLLSAPVLQGDMAFVTAVSWDGSLRGNHSLIAIDVVGMRIAHSVYFGNSVLGADAIVAGDAVLVNSEDGKLYCVDSPSGKLRWAADDAGGSDASPVISNSGTLVFSGTSSGVCALRLVDGSRVWCTDLGEVWGHPQVSPDDSAVFAAGENGTVACLEASSGKVRWMFHTSDDIQSGVTLSADGRALFIGSRDSNVYALDTATGALSWQFQTGRAITADAVIAASLVLIGSEDSHFYALDAATGKPAWNVTAAGPLSFIDCSLSPNLDAVYFSCSHGEDDDVTEVYKVSLI